MVKITLSYDTPDGDWRDPSMFGHYDCKISNEDWMEFVKNCEEYNIPWSWETIPGGEENPI